MTAILGGLLGLIGIASLVCWIIVLIKIFKDNVGLGILGIFCGLFTFIYGWVKAKEYQIQKVMLTWTILTVVWTILYFGFFAAAFRDSGITQEWQMDMQYNNMEQTDY